jgi:hypothetical protein
MFHRVSCFFLSMHYAGLEWMTVSVQSGESQAGKRSYARVAKGYSRHKRAET